MIPSRKASLRFLTWSLLMIPVAVMIVRLAQEQAPSNLSERRKATEKERGMGSELENVKHLWLESII